MRFSNGFRLAALVTGIALSSGLANASATNIYIAQSVTGSANGSSCASAYVYTFFNAVANWGLGAAQIGPGTTVHICGTISFPANAWAFAFQGSGSSGNPITLFFESGAVLTSPAWVGGGGAIGLGGQSYVVVDGGLNGVIQATANGTGLANQVASVIIGATYSSNVEIKNLTLSNIYVHTSGGTGDPDVSAGGGVYANGYGTLSIHDNVMHDIGWCINLQGGTSTSVNIYNNNIYNIDHGLALGFTNSSQSLTNVNVYNNHIHDTANWDTAANTWHHDGIHAYNYSGGTANNWAFYNNIFDGNWGINNTAHIYMETNLFSNLLIYNNVFIQSRGNLLNNGMLTIGATTGSIYNNTFLCDPAVSGMEAATISGTNLSIKNNAWSGCQTYLVIPSIDTFVTGGLDYNFYSGSAGGGIGAWSWKGSGKTSFSAWKFASGGDVNGLNPSTVGLSGTGVPQTGSAAIGAGVNLTSAGITSLDSGTSAGNTVVPVKRPASGAWDVGAYESAGATASPPAPPTVLTVTAK